MVKLVHGVGISKDGEYLRGVGGTPTVEYILWKNMLARCYAESWRQSCPTYADCTVSENFLDFQYFAKWCNGQIGFGNKNWQLDKDILSSGNKVYSESTCVFVPREINMAVRGKMHKSNELPTGVSYHTDSGRYVAQCGINGKRVHVGLYKDPQEAFTAYSIEKLKYIKETAELWRDQVDARVYEAMINMVVQPYP